MSGERDSAGRDGAASPYHPGEQAMQQRAGVRDKAERLARGLRDFMPDQHRDFFAELPFLLVGSVDDLGRVWTSVLTGAPGFAHSPDPRSLRIDARPGTDDALAATLRLGAPLGLLGIQLETRRRNRMNGRVTAIDANGFTVGVELSFGNCPKYIQIRETRPAPAGPASPPSPETSVLSPEAVALIERADTLFIATAAPDTGTGGSSGATGVDVNHRGGRPGFVRIGADGTGRTSLAFADLPGNNAFATFGNIAVNPHAGMLFVDFDTGGLLSLTGRAEVLWDGAADAEIAGAERVLRFRPELGHYVRSVLPFRWSPSEPAPQFTP
jgi:predicted pyridoxine 5'-phosphate oxidase superfamily flavin-nucleotide-binding protein